MTTKFIFWAQSLDNTSSDYIDFHGEHLSSDNAPRRQEAVSLVSSVVKTGFRIFDQDGVQLTQDGCRFVLEVPSAERDCAGRISPIVCFGEFNSPVDDKFGADVVADMDIFAAHISRTINPAHIDLVKQSFVILKKRPSTRPPMCMIMPSMKPIALIAGIVALIIALLILISMLNVRSLR